MKRILQLFQSLAKIDPSLAAALGSTKKTNPEAAKVLARHIFQDTMIPKMGNKFAYSDFVSRHKNDGVHVHIDLNDFGQINKLHGEKLGDHAITSAGNIIAETSRMFGGKSFRKGGDEMSAWFDRPEAAHGFARELRTRLEQHPKIGNFDPVQHQRHGLTPDYKGHALAASIGIGFSPDHAEKALLMAKSQLGPMDVSGKRKNLHSLGDAPTVVHSLLHETPHPEWKQGKGAPVSNAIPAVVPQGMKLNNPLAKTLPPPVYPLEDQAKAYAAHIGVPYAPSHHGPLDESILHHVAREYEAAPHMPDHPDVKAAYDALKRETLIQYQFLKSRGYKFTVAGGNATPYQFPTKAFDSACPSKFQYVDDNGNPLAGAAPYDHDFENLYNDIQSNKHLVVFTGGHPNPDHPLAEKLPFEDPLGTYNNVFRAVHDIFGHGLGVERFRATQPAGTEVGLDLGHHGEDHAYRAQASMYSPLARKALASETRGQNAAFHFGVNGKSNRANPTKAIYPDQKATLLPDHLVEHGLTPPKLSGNTKFQKDEFSIPPPNPHPALAGARVGIMTGENPLFPVHTQGQNVALENELRQLGLKYEKVRGKYGNEENSYLIHNPSQDLMVDLGKRYGQESVVLSDKGNHKLIYTNGPHAGTYHPGGGHEIFPSEPDDFYSTVMHQGQPLHFQYKIDFSQQVPLEPEQNNDLVTTPLAQPPQPRPTT